MLMRRKQLCNYWYFGGTMSIENENWIFTDFNLWTCDISMMTANWLQSSLFKYASIHFSLLRASNRMITESLDKLNSALNILSLIQVQSNWIAITTSFNMNYKTAHRRLHFLIWSCCKSLRHFSLVAWYWLSPYFHILQQHNLHHFSLRTAALIVQRARKGPSRKAVFKIKDWIIICEA